MTERRRGREEREQASADSQAGKEVSFLVYMYFWKISFEFHLSFCGQYTLSWCHCCSPNRNKEVNGVCECWFLFMYTAGFHFSVYRKCYWMACSMPKAHQYTGNKWTIARQSNMLRGMLALLYICACVCVVHVCAIPCSSRNIMYHINSL